MNMRLFLFFMQALLVNCFMRSSFNRCAFSCKSSSETNPQDRNYNPFGRKYYEEYIKKLNSRNSTAQTATILGLYENQNSNFIHLSPDGNITFPAIIFNETEESANATSYPNIKIIFQKQRTSKKL